MSFSAGSDGDGPAIGVRLLGARTPAECWPHA